MNILRRGLLLIISPLFVLLLFATAFDWGVVRTVGQPSSVKSILDESGIYDTIIPNLLDQAKQQSSEQGNISLTDPAVKTAANQALSPTYIQTQANTVIDSVYAWLDGKTTQPDFHVDLSGPKTTFASSLAAQVQQRAASLPTCTAQTNADSYDALTATCLPPGVTPVAAGQSVQQNILSGKGFLDNPVITAGAVKNGDSNQSVFADQLKSAPKQYQRVKKTPYILALLTLVLAAVIVALSPTHWRALRHLGITLITVGIFMLIFSWALNRVIATKLVPKIKVDNSVLQQKVRILATDLTQRVDKNYWGFGIVYTTLGAAALAAPYVINKRGSKPKPQPQVSEAAEPEAPAAARPPKKKPIKIQ